MALSRTPSPQLGAGLCALLAVAFISAPTPVAAESIDNRCRFNWWSLDEAVPADLVGVPALPVIILPLAWRSGYGYGDNHPSDHLDRVVVEVADADGALAPGAVSLTDHVASPSVQWRPAAPLALGRHTLSVTATWPGIAGYPGQCPESVVAAEMVFHVEDVASSPVTPTLTGELTTSGTRQRFPEGLDCADPRALPCPGSSARCYHHWVSFIASEDFDGELTDLGPRASHYFAFRLPEVAGGAWVRATSSHVGIGGSTHLTEEPPPPTAPLCRDVEVLDILFDQVILEQTFCADPADYFVEEGNDAFYAMLLDGACNDDSGSGADPDFADAGDGWADASGPGSANGPGSSGGCHSGGTSLPLAAALALALAHLLRRRLRGDHSLYR